MLLSATVSPHDINAICNKIGINDANLCVVWGRDKRYFTLYNKKNQHLSMTLFILFLHPMINLLFMDQLIILVMRYMK